MISRIAYLGLARRMICLAAKGFKHRAGNCELGFVSGIGVSSQGIYLHKIVGA